MEPSKRWFAHAMVCQLQSVLNSFVEVAQNYNFQKTVESGSSPPASILSSCFTSFEKLLENTRGAMDDSSSSFLFNSQPLSFRDKRKRESPPKKGDPKKQRSSEPSTKGWLVSSGPYSFPSSWSVTPCKNFAEEGKPCAFGRSCDFDHKLYPKGYTCKLQALICRWVKDTPTVKFASFVRESDRSITYAPRNNAAVDQSANDSSSGSQQGTTSEPAGSSTTSTNDSATPSAD